jgi:hypothetical protein
LVPCPADESEPSSRATGSDEPRPAAGPNAEPLTVEVLRRKLDAAISAEEWAVVKILHGRIVEAERGAAWNVVPIGTAKPRGR